MKRMLLVMALISSTAFAEQLLVAEQIVTLVPNSFGCVTEAALHEAVLYATRHEKTKFASMFSSFDCWALPSGVKFKLLHVGYSTIEITNAMNVNQSAGLWSPIEYAIPSK